MIISETTDRVIVDARFAGGHIVVERSDDYLGDGRPGVQLELPGATVWLFPHEARALADALQRTSAPAPALRRRRDAVDELHDLEG